MIENIKNLIKQVIPFIPGINITFKAKDDNIYLTFDDGPNDRLTRKVLDILKKENIKASFFLIGKHIEKFPDMVNEILKDGHVIGNHSYSHKHFSKETVNVLKEEVDQTSNLLSGHSVMYKYYRPPYGEANFQQMRWLNKNMNQIFFWSFDFMPLLKKYGNDLNKITKAVKPGDIILLHDDDKEVVEILPTVIELLKKRGLHFNSLTVN